MFFVTILLIYVISANPSISENFEEELFISRLSKDEVLTNFRFIIHRNLSSTEECTCNNNILMNIY